MDKEKPMTEAEVVHKLMSPGTSQNQKILDQFFGDLKTMASSYREWVGQVPKELVINPAIIAKLSREEGFYQRPELQAQINAHVPIVRYINVGFGVVTIIEDYMEQFFHFR